MLSHPQTRFPGSGGRFGVGNKAKGKGENPASVLSRSWENICHKGSSYIQGPNKHTGSPEEAQEATQPACSQGPSQQQSAHAHMHTHVHTHTAHVHTHVRAHTPGLASQLQ